MANRVKSQLKSYQKLVSQGEDAINGIFARPIPPYQESQFKGRGIVICAGGYKYFPSAWILINMLRHLGCDLPIQLWHWGADEINYKMKRICRGLDIEFVDATRYSPPIEPRCTIKPIAIANSRFEQVLFIDADNLPIKDPTYLFELSEYKDAGTIFWPGINWVENENPIRSIVGIDPYDGPQVDSGQILINKKCCWDPLIFLERMAHDAEVFYHFAYGGNDLFRIAWQKFNTKFSVPRHAPQMLSIPDPLSEAMDVMLCQHDFSGARIFQHRAARKWDLMGENPWISGAFFENECRGFLGELKRRWNGRCNVGKKQKVTTVARQYIRSLVDRPWLLDIPEALLSPPVASFVPIKDEKLFPSQLPNFVKIPQDVGRMNFKGDVRLKQPIISLPSVELKEIKFSSNGTVSQNADAQTGVFWDISSNVKCPELILSTEDLEVARFKRQNNNCWVGKYSSGPASGVTAKLRTVGEAFPHLANGSRLGSAGVLAVRNEITHSYGKNIHISCASSDVGDHIAATYACVGLARLGVSVTFHTQHAAWLSRVSEPGLLVTKKPSKSCLEIDKDRDWRLRYGTSKAAWYAANIHPQLHPIRPAVKDRRYTSQFPFKNYIALAPYTRLSDLSKDKNWPDIHWTRLAGLLRGKGYEIVAIAEPSQEPALLRIFSQTQVYWAVNYDPQWITDVLLGASGYIGVDNDITHLAALLKVNGVAIHAQFQGSYLWPFNEIQSVSPSAKCAFCRLQADRGFLASCELGCSAMATVNPEAVADQLLKIVKPFELL